MTTDVVYLTTTEAAQLASERLRRPISRRLVTTWCRTNKLPAIRAGGRYYVQQRALETMLSEG